MMAGEALAETVKTALTEVGALNGCYDGRPLRATAPFAIVETGFESDWGHKNGAGREVRLSVTIRDSGERPTRLRTLSAEAESALAGIGSAAGDWRIVSLSFLRSRLLPDGDHRWVSVLEYLARMLAEA